MLYYFQSRVNRQGKRIILGFTLQHAVTPAAGRAEESNRCKLFITVFSSCYLPPCPCDCRAARESTRCLVVTRSYQYTATMAGRWTWYCFLKGWPVVRVLGQFGCRCSGVLQDGVSVWCHLVPPNTLKHKGLCADSHHFREVLKPCSHLLRPHCCLITQTAASLASIHHVVSGNQAREDQLFDIHFIIVTLHCELQGHTTEWPEERHRCTEPLPEQLKKSSYSLQITCFNLTDRKAYLSAPWQADQVN